MQIDKQIKKASPYYQDFICSVWEEQHPEDLKSDGFCWKSWEEVSKK